MEDDVNRFAVNPKVDTHFSWLRTRLSMERTLMSWIRTATALIGFGFTIVQFFERFKTMDTVSPPVLPQASRYLGLALIGSGVIGLIVSAWEYRSMLHYLWSQEFAPVAGTDKTPAHTPTLMITIVLILIGIYAFTAVLLRLT